MRMECKQSVDMKTGQETGTEVAMDDYEWEY